MKSSARTETIQLRRDGASYEALMQEAGVAKSTVWRWLKAEGLVASQPQQITELRRAAQRKGAAKVKAQRIARTQATMDAARQEIGSLSARDLWLLGLALYWAEGSKQKPTHVSAQAIFTNSDPGTLRLMRTWLRVSCGVADERLSFEIYLHETADAERARRYWSEALDVPLERLQRVRWKRHKIAKRRTYVGNAYYGLVRMRVACSSDLNRRISGWIAGVSQTPLGSGVMGTHLTLDQKIPGSIPGSPAFRPQAETQSIRNER